MTLISSVGRPSGPAVLTTAGLLWTLVSTLDPSRPAGSMGGPLLCLAALALRARRGLSVRPCLFACTLAGSLALGVFAHPEFRRGDFRPYYAYLRSVAFDHDLEFTNEFRAWGLPLPPLTPTGYRSNQHTPGPAIVWSPFFVAAHVYVVASGAFGLSHWPADGNSQPYLRSALAGTVTAVVVGLWLLVSFMERHLPRRIAILAAVAAVATSPMLVYTFAEPGMAHGACFGLACAGLWAVDRAKREPGLASWALLGGILGLIVLMRLQAGVFWLVALPFVLTGLLKRSLRPTWLLAAAATAFLALAPQLIAWKVLYGRWLTVGGDLGRWAEETGRPIQGEVLFRPEASLDFSAPYLRYVLFSTDRGLFTWTPGILVALGAFLLGLRRWGLLGLGGVLVLVATAWFNGSFRLWWSAGDAFGARRFDIVIPLAALGYGTLIQFLERRPFLAPTLLVAALAAWNMGLAHLWRTSAVGDTVPLKEVAALQIGQFQRALERELGRLWGPYPRAWIYDYFVGRLFFTNTVHDGAIDVASPTQPYLTGGWSPAVNEAGPPSFRLALFPRACVRVPLLRPLNLEARITARAPSKLRDQVVKVTLNDQPLTRIAFEADWAERKVSLPASAMVPGENLLCLEFDDSIPGADGLAIGAQVRRIVVH